MEHTPNDPARSPTCSHGPFIEQQTHRMLELGDTLAALQTKFNAAKEVNTKFEAMLQSEENHRRSYAIATAKQLARTEVLIHELEKARERERVLEEINRELHAAIDWEIGRNDEMLATQHNLIQQLQLLMCFAPTPLSQQVPTTGLVFQ